MLSARPSVCLYHKKTVEFRIMKIFITSLVVAGYVSSRNSKGFPQAVVSNKEEWAKSAVFYL